MEQRLSQVDVLVIDCQATAAATAPPPGGHLLEIGWARVVADAEAAEVAARARLIRLPDGVRVPAVVERITGISEQMLIDDGVDACDAWRELIETAATLAQQPAPTVIHYARFERPFLRALAAADGEVPRAEGPLLGARAAAAGELPFDIVDTHEIARRLLPDLPRCSLRALTGYFGRAVGIGGMRRAADHVEATAFVWRELVRLLDAQGVTTWCALREWLAKRDDAAAAASGGAAAGVTAGVGVGRAKRRRVWPMPREIRLSLPDSPGLYRMQRTTGSVLYVGKAASLRHRVNSYFRHQRGVPERMLEMLSQARDISFEIAPSALEAALLEPDEIKRHQPPYNIALTEERAVWFASVDLSERSPHASAQFPVGPIPSAETLDQFVALANASRFALGGGRWAPPSDIFDAGYERLRAAHAELRREDISISAYSRVLRLGTRLWQEGRRDRDVDLDTIDADVPEAIDAWTPDRVQVALEWIALRAALARRRARWLTRMVDASVVWSEAGVAGARLIVIEHGEITTRVSITPDVVPPIPPGHERTVADRHEGFTIARFDRLRVLTTELKRLIAEGAPVALRFGAAPALTGARLAYALSWV